MCRNVTRRKATTRLGDRSAVTWTGRLFGASRAVRTGGRVVAARVARGLLVVLRCTLDRENPGLPTLHPNFILGLQIERCVVECPDPNLDVGIAGLGSVQ